MLLTERSGRPFDNFVNLVDAGDYGRALLSRQRLLAEDELSLRELMALGEAELAGGWFSDARDHLLEAFERAQNRDTKARAAWLISQTFYLEDRFDRSLEWVGEAERFGLEVSRSHRGFLEVLADTDAATRVEGARSGPIPMAFGEPLIPRVEVVLNGETVQTAVVDSGAVYTIVSARLAERAGVETLNRRGTLLGLLGEEITIEYGVLRSLRIGELTVTNLPVAIMPNEDLNFFTAGKQTFQMDMLLGANLLRRFVLDFDFEGRVLRVERVPSGARPETGQNMFLVGFRPMVQATINRRGWYMFLIDTGSEVTFLNSDKLEATAVRGREQIHGATLQGLGGARKRGAQLLNTEVALAGWGGMFATLPLYAQGDSDSYGIVGQNFLSRFRVLIDFGAMRIDLLKDGQSAEDLQGVVIRE